MIRLVGTWKPLDYMLANLVLMRSGNRGFESVSSLERWESYQSWVNESVIWRN